MRALVACEFSGAIRDALIKRGVDAWSVDLLPGEGHNVHRHVQDDVMKVLGIEWYDQPNNTGYTFPDGVTRWQNHWDMLIAHPSCQYLANSGVRWLYNKDGSDNVDRWNKMYEAADFFYKLLNCDVPRIAIENPIIHKHSNLPKPTFVCQPWWFGHGETKATCWWLRGLQPLKPTNIVEGRQARVHRMPPGPDRWKERSRTLPGVAAAIADQWGKP